MRKKDYISPITTMSDVKLVRMLATSSVEVGGSGKFDASRQDSDWDNIWK